MSVPAFSLSVVLPGAPSAPAGIGATASSGAGLFEGVLAGLVSAADDAAPATADPANPRPDQDQRVADTAAPLDPGLAILFASPGPAPTLPTAPPADGDSDGARSFGDRHVGLSGIDFGGHAVAHAGITSEPDTLTGLPTAGPAPSAIREAVRQPPAPPTDGGLLATLKLPDRVGPGQTVPAVDAKAATPAPAVAQPVPVPAAAPAAATPLPQAAPPVLAAAAAAAVGAAPVAEASEPPLPAPAPTVGEARRAAVARGERRPDVAGRFAPTGPANDSPVKQAALAAIADPGAAGIGDTADAEAAPVEVAVADIADAAETRQPALPSEIRAQASQAAVAAEAAAAAQRGSPETVAKLAADIVRKLDGQNTRFDLELNPHGMGKVDVAIEIDRNGRLTAAMSFDSAQSAAELRSRAGDLRLALEQAGFSVSDGGLTFDTAGAFAGFGGQSAAQQHQHRAWNGRAFQRAQSGVEEADLSLTSASNPTERRTRSGVDIRI